MKKIRERLRELLWGVGISVLMGLAFENWEHVLGSSRVVEEALKRSLQEIDEPAPGAVIAGLIVFLFLTTVVVVVRKERADKRELEELRKKLDSEKVTSPKRKVTLGQVQRDAALQLAGARAQAGLPPSPYLTYEKTYMPCPSPQRPDPRGQIGRDPSSSYIAPSYGIAGSSPEPPKPNVETWKLLAERREVSKYLSKKGVK